MNWIIGFVVAFVFDIGTCLLLKVQDIGVGMFIGLVGGLLAIGVATILEDGI